MVQSIKKNSFFLFIFFSSYILTAQEEREIFIGQTLILNDTSLSEINVSRKGVIDIFYLNKEKKWQVTGHKEGFVIISYFSEKYQKEKRIFFFVKKKKLVQSNNFFSTRYLAKKKE
ncbi:MAG: hypothetical protein CMP11_06580 [Zetaproteobacteria bacterium]|nr:hypothetical protein [Pseudobdellovibrionaceae bacterium]